MLRVREYISGICGVEYDFHDIIFTSFNMSKFMNLDARITIESVRSRKCDVKFNIISIIKNILFFLFVSGSKFLHFSLLSLKMSFPSHIKDGSKHILGWLWYYWIFPEHIKWQLLVFYTQIWSLLYQKINFILVKNSLKLYDQWWFPKIYQISIW